MSAHDLVIGLDVGSTTVKAVVVHPDSLEILWNDYQRHHTEQPEKLSLIHISEPTRPY